MMHYEQPPVREHRISYFHTTRAHDGSGSSRSVPHAFQTPLAKQTPDDVTALLLRWSDGDVVGGRFLAPLDVERLAALAD